MQGKEDYKYFNIIQNLISNLGVDSTDIYLRLKIFIITRQVVIVRDKICKIREELSVHNNSDEIRHLMFDFEEEKNSMNNLLEELGCAHDMYVYYKEYIKNSIVTN